MNFREGVALAVATCGPPLFPQGMLNSALFFFICFVLLAVGLALFFTGRMSKRAERIEKESTERGGSGSQVPTDMHNYSGWRSGGRREDLESTSESSGGDAD